MFSVILKVNTRACCLVRLRAMACVNAAFHSSHQFNMFAKFHVHGRACRLPVRTFTCGSSVQHVRAGVCHPIMWKASLRRKRSLPSSTRFRKCFHLSFVTTRVCHPLTDLVGSLPPDRVSMWSSLPRGACRPDESSVLVMISSRF